MNVCKLTYNGFYYFVENSIECIVMSIDAIKDEV